MVEKKYNTNLNIRIDKEFYFKKWVLKVNADVQNAYEYKTAGAPIYTNKNKVTGEAEIDPNDNTRYILREVEDNFSGVLLPTIGLIVKI